MAISGYFFNALRVNDEYDRIYNAEDVTSYLDLLVGNGVFPNPSNQLQVSAAGGMGITVNAGQGWINGHKMINSAAIPYTLAASDALLNRIDRVVFYADYSAREMGIEVKQGTPATNATAPALVRDSTRYEMSLATVTVTKGATAVTQADITDTRGNSDVCGFVQGLVQQADTSTLFTQWDAAGQAQITANQNVWDEWLEEVQQALVSGTLDLQRYTTYITTRNETVAAFDVDQYFPTFNYAVDYLDLYINGLKLNPNDYTMSGAHVMLTVPITHAGTVIEITIWQQRAVSSPN